MSDVQEASVNAESAHPAIEDYHEFLAANPAMCADSQALLAQLSLERKLTFGGVPFSRYLRPHFVTPGQHAIITDVVRSLASAFIKLRRAAMQSESLLAQLDLTPEERRLCMIDPGFEEPSTSARLDSFWSERDWRFVEMNAEAPASIAYEDVLAEVFLELPVIQQWAAKRGYNLQALYARDRFMQSIEEMWSEFRNNRGADRFSARPNIAIVDWDGVPTSSEFELFQEYFESRGYKVLITDPRRLEFSGGRLRDGDFAIDIFYKRVLTSELLAMPDVARPITDAYEAGAVCITNSFRAKVLHKKMSLALLHDDANAHLFSKHELEVIKKHIPWTRKVADGYTTFDGQRTDLLPFIAQNREHLVLKPNDEYGGKGVSIGWTMTDDEWQKAMRESLMGSSVVQWAVHLDHERYPYFDQEHGVSFIDLTADLDPFVFGTDTQGALTRLSSAALLNVTAGTGSVVPTMVVSRSS